jgi:hypothetical protein
MPSLRARAALEEGVSEGAGKPIEVGRYAPYPVWMTVILAVRFGQVLGLGCFAWSFAALFDAASPPFTISTPPLWLWLVAGILAADDGKCYWRWQTRPAGNAVGSLFAAKQCPACGQNIFDHTPPRGYEPPQQQYRNLPLRHCAGCGHDLARRTASPEEP